MTPKQVSRKRTISFAPPAPGHDDFWAIVHVKLAAPLPDVDDPGATPAQGYYRVFGIRAAPDRVHKLLDATIEDGAIDWTDTECSQVDPSSLKREIQSRIEPVAGEGIWYSSGRVYYADPDLEPPPH